MGSGPSRSKKMDTDQFIEYVRVYSALFIDRTPGDKPLPTNQADFEQWKTARSKESQYKSVVTDLKPIQDHIVNLTKLLNEKKDQKTGTFFPTKSINTYMIKVLEYITYEMGAIYDYGYWMLVMSYVMNDTTSYVIEDLKNVKLALKNTIGLLTSPATRNSLLKSPVELGITADLEKLINELGPQIGKITASLLPPDKLTQVPLTNTPVGHSK